MRADGRLDNALREVKIQRGYTAYAEGSVLVCFGNTHVLCNASVTEGVPRFMKGSKRGWVTAEYSMLPRATHERRERDSIGRPNGRNLEIQRLIGRTLRSMVNLSAIGENTIVVDCDVLQADGGTRTAAITGAAVALQDALSFLCKKNRINVNPILHMVASVSVGIFQGQAILDLNYLEDSKAQTDMNIVMNDRGEFIEIQGTAENQTFSHQQLQQMLALAQQGIEQLLVMQQKTLAEPL